jgi:hypothetical protein
MHEGLLHDAEVGRAEHSYVSMHEGLLCDAGFG